MNNSYKKEPLVTILVYNYNYGKYLPQCIESILNQTHKNIEINFSDNASTDDSWEIILEYIRKFPNKITATRNRINFGVDDNFINCWTNFRGEYFINMCSDDILDPKFIEKTLFILENNVNVNYVISHRSIIDSKGKEKSEKPFYKESCIIKGYRQAAVYMMAAVNPSNSQIMYRKTDIFKNASKHIFGGRWYGARVLDFTLSLSGDVGYIKEPLVKHRIHGENDSLSAASNLLEVIGPYIMNYQFIDLSNMYNLENVKERLDPSIKKIATLSLRYSVRALLENNIILAKRYYHLSAAFDYNISETQLFKTITNFWNQDKQSKEKILKELEESSNLVTREISYDIPEESTIIAIP